MESAYKIIEVIGSSEKTWEDAAKNAIKAASKSLKDLRIAEVVEMDIKIEEGKALTFRTKLKVSFKVLES